MENKGPVKTIRYGAVYAKIWENQRQGKEGMFTVRTVQVGKTYMDLKEKKLKDTNTLQSNDVPKMQYCLTEAYKWLAENKTTNDEE